MNINPLDAKQKFSEEEIKKIVSDYKKYTSGRVVMDGKEINEMLNNYEDNIGNMEECEKNITTTYLKAREYIGDFVDRRDSGEAVDLEDPKGKHFWAVFLFFEDSIKYGYDEKMPVLMRKMKLLFNNYCICTISKTQPKKKS